MYKKAIKVSTIIGVLAIVSVFFQNCGSGSFSSVSTSSSEIKLSANPGPDFSAFKFTAFGGFAPENQPANFDDILFKYDEPVLTADSDTRDTECIKPTFTVGDSDRDKIFALIENLDVKKAKDLVPIADAPEQKIILFLNDGSEKTIFLGPGGAKNGNLIASNGAELTKFLHDLNTRIPVACKTPKDPDGLTSISFFSGGGFRPPDTPDWDHKMKFTITSQGVFAKVEVHDSSCFKPEFKLSQEDSRRLLAAIEGLKIETLNVPFVIADAPTEAITLDYVLSADSRIHLNAHSASNGEPFATNGAELVKLFKELADKIPTACY